MKSRTYRSSLIYCESVGQYMWMIQRTRQWVQGTIWVTILGVVRVGMIVWETGVDVERSLLENYGLKVFHRNLSCLRRFFSHSFFTAISFPITDPKSFLKSTKNSFIVTVLSAPIYFEKKSHKRVWNKSKKCDRFNQDRKIVLSLLMSLWCHRRVTSSGILLKAQSKPTPDTSSRLWSCERQRENVITLIKGAKAHISLFITVSGKNRYCLSIIIIPYCYL